MGAPRVTFDAFVKRSREIHGDKYDYSKVDWANTKSKVEIVCPVHGSFLQMPFKHLAGQGCPDCRKNADVTQEMFIERARQMHGDKYDYSRVHYQGMWVPVEIICPVHGSFFQMPAKHVKTGESGTQGCPDCRYARQRQTFQTRYGVGNPMKKREFVDTNWEAKKKNGTCNSSKPEDQIYKDLVRVFGRGSVERNYNKDSRYPFFCDFYISSHDIFIELHGTWYHGGHFFDADNEDDLDTLRSWKARGAKGHPAYLVAIKTWTVADPLKRQTAEKNGLNYFVFWDNDLTDFHTWLQDYIELNRTA